MSDDLDRSHEAMRRIYSEWRQSLTYGRVTYKDVSDSIDIAVERCAMEIPNQVILTEVIGRYMMMKARLSEFTCDTEFDVDEIPDIPIDPNVPIACSCRGCGREIAEYEEKFPLDQSRVPTFLRAMCEGMFICVDCHIKA